MRIYLAASWRNAFHREVLELLCNDGHAVYDFKNPLNGLSGFSWKQTDMPERPNAADNRHALLTNMRIAQGFMNDFRAMLWCDCCVMLLPSGRSAHAEMGYCAGAGKRTVVYLRDGEEPDLMHLLASDLVHSDAQLLSVLR